MKHAGSTDPSAVKLSPQQRFWFYGTFAALFLSGFAWFFLQCMRAVYGGNLEAWPEGFESRLLQIHGVAAILFLVACAVLMPVHIKQGIAAKRRQRSGSIVGGMIVLSAATGFVLYYSGNVTLREITQPIHVCAGLILPRLLMPHLFAKHKNKKHKRMAGFSE